MEVGADEQALRGAETAGRGHAVVLALFATAIFVGAGLVFLVQPMVAKLMLPYFGGSASVWITSMVFFQAVLLAGYGYVHATTSLLGTRHQRYVQIGLLAATAALLPVGDHLTAPPDGWPPALWLVGILAVSVGAPFLAVTTASPVLQQWFSTTRHEAARDPYFLYAAGNVGSLLALLAYPLVVEPRLSLDQQVDLWTVGFLAFVGLSLACSLLVRQATTEPAQTTRAGSPRLAWRVRFRWVLLAFVPSSLMLGTTSFISTDVASVPLLWTLPLSVYLLTFIAAFSRRNPLPVERAAKLLPFVILLALPTFATGLVPIWAVVLTHLLLLFVGGVLAHGRLVAERPATDRLTEFYVLLSVGGVLGGLFNAVIAPVVFDTVVEYVLAIALVLLLRPATPTATSFGKRGAVLALSGLLVVGAVAVTAAGGLGVLNAPNLAKMLLGAVVATALLLVARPSRFSLLLCGALALTVVIQSSVVYADRTFYGVLRVRDHDGERRLVHGTTVHGSQSLDAAHTRRPLTYYGRTGPIGDVFRTLQRATPFQRVDVIGLGVGTLASYGQRGQTFTFYELDPAVVRIAENPELFTYLRDTNATVDVVVGDGRLTLEDAPDGASDLIVVDAFSSDGIPVHLLTREAVSLYLSKLSTRGVVAFNISNRHLRLWPVLGAVAGDLGLVALQRADTDEGGVKLERGKSPSRWLVLARDSRAVAGLTAAGWRHVPDSGARVWTDDYSNVLAAIVWR